MMKFRCVLYGLRRSVGNRIQPFFINGAEKRYQISLYKVRSVCTGTLLLISGVLFKLCGYISTFDYGKYGMVIASGVCPTRCRVNTPQRTRSCVFCFQLKIRGPFIQHFWSVSWLPSGLYRLGEPEGSSCPYCIEQYCGRLCRRPVFTFCQG